MLRSIGAYLAPSLRWQILPATNAWALSVRGLKETTGIVGLAVHPEARKNLKSRMEEVLRRVQELIPEHAEYRKVVEATMNYR